MFKVNNNKCINCFSCINDCPTKTIFSIDNQVVIKDENCIQCGHCYAICPTEAVISSDTPEKLESFSISEDDYLNFLVSKRSIRQFQNKKIDIEKIKKLIEAGRLTATGRNLQDVRFIVFSNEIENLTKVSLEALNTLGDNLLKTKSTQFMRYAKLFKNLYESYNNSKEKYEDRLFFNAPLILLIVSQNKTNGVLASKNIDNMVSFMGLGCFYSGFFTRACEDSQALKDFLKLKENEEVSACLVIGYPKISYRRGVPRKKADISWR